MSLKYRLYSLIRRVLPIKLVRRLGGSHSIAFLRDRFFRPTGIAEWIRGRVEWDGLSLSFCAPYQVLYRAQTTGIEPYICRLARRLLTEGDTAIDVGAHYGFMSLVMAKSTGSSGHLLSFEIDPYIAEGLARNIADNGLSRVSIVIAKGAGAPRSEGLVTVDEIVASHQLDRVRFIKIDVDGTDFQVLLGAKETLRRHHPVVVIEFLQNQREIYQFLLDSGYTCFTDPVGSVVNRDTQAYNLVASMESLFSGE